MLNPHTLLLPPPQTQSSTLDEVIESFSFLAKDVYVTATVNEETSDMFLNMLVSLSPRSCRWYGRLDRS